MHAPSLEPRIHCVFLSDTFTLIITRRAGLRCSKCDMHGLLDMNILTLTLACGIHTDRHWADVLRTIEESAPFDAKILNIV